MKPLILALSLLALSASAQAAPLPPLWQREIYSFLIQTNPELNKAAESILGRATHGPDDVERIFKAIELLSARPHAVGAIAESDAEYLTRFQLQLFTIENNTARLRVVVPGEVEGDQIRIVNGLAGNETVAVSAQHELFDGAPVQVR